MVDFLKMAAQTPCVVVQIVSASGSTPRHTGARMLVGHTGLCWGSVGGGAIEAQGLQMAREVLADGVTRVATFTLTSEQAGSIGMVCGGAVTLQAQLVTDAVMAELAASERPPKEVHIYGGGHVAQALVPVLAPLAFQCFVYDDRAAFAMPALFPQAAGVQVVQFDKLPSLPSDKAYAVVMTRGHSHDTAVLSQLLTAPPFYIGCIGSLRKKEVVNQQLTTLGFSLAQIGRIHTPIGLAIGAETPAEIAISIAAELIAVSHACL